MEFDYRKAFKGIDGKAVNPANPFEQGTAYFTSGQEGEQVQNPVSYTHLTLPTKA